MDMSVTSIGAGLVTPMELPQERGAAQRVQIRAAQHLEAIKTLDAALPGRTSDAPRPELLTAATADMERISSAFNKRLQFVVDHSSKEVIVKVIDRETDKVIKELPPEELQRLHSKLKETIGFLFDERV
ncbi:hypothetical protein AGMMS50293_16320 [Spirochaetia bacterium]|nr:hypothetical protein AGMMS50293_16320 [Spirochaetia bacterium]